MKHRIKILFCIDQLNIGGTEKQLLAIIEQLDRTQFELYLVCLRPTIYFEQCGVHCKKQVLGVESLISLDGLGKLLRFSQYLRQEKIDIVQTFFFDSTVFGVLAAKLAGVKKIISCRRDMGFWYTFKLLMVLRGINLLTDRILVNSEAIKKNVCEKERLSSAKIDVIYNGIDLRPFAVKHDVQLLKETLGIPASDSVIGIVANLNREVKRVDLFLKAAAAVLKKQSRVSFVIVGAGHLRDELEQQARSLNIFNECYFVGSQECVIPYLQLFDIGVLTSESEGFSNSILEYMAAGLPVVCFNSGGNGEIIRDGVNGFLVSTFSSRILSEKICSLLSDNLARGKMIGKKNFEDAKKFSWDAIVEDVSFSYKK